MCMNKRLSVAVLAGLEMSCLTMFILYLPMHSKQAPVERSLQDTCRKYYYGSGAQPPALG